MAFRKLLDGTEFRFDTPIRGSDLIGYCVTATTMYRSTDVYVERIGFNGVNVGLFVMDCKARVAVLDPVYSENGIIPSEQYFAIRFQYMVDDESIIHGDDIYVKNCERDYARMLQETIERFRPAPSRSYRSW